MFRRRIPFTQMAFATVLGVAGGVYIYRPYFEPLQKSPGQQHLDVPKNESEPEEKYSSLSENLGHTEAQKTIPEAGRPSEPEAGRPSEPEAGGPSEPEARTDIKASTD